MELLAINHLQKKYGGVVALKDLSMTVIPGEIVGVMGANGAGKTTLFSLIAGHDQPTAGEIKFDGQHLNGRSPDQICRMGIARTFQIVRPLRGLSVLDNITIAVRFGDSRTTREPEIIKRSHEILENLELEDRAPQFAGTLTLSDQKRLEVARAVATGPRLLLLDEVMAGLTLTAVQNMMDAIVRLKKIHSLTVLVIEHVMRALMTLSDRIVVLHHGELIAHGTPEEVAANTVVQNAYLGSSA